jgi:hypothetical protein
MRAAHRTGKPILESTSADALRDLPCRCYYFDFEGRGLRIEV